MSVDVDIEGLARRLVTSRKRDGRCVYDPGAKRELIEACLLSGLSVTKLARECGVNANLLSTWVRQHERQTPGLALAAVVEMPAPAFIPVNIEPAKPQASQPGLDLQARLPNGVVVDLRGCAVDQASLLIETLGMLRCSASTKA
jgi:transposase